jgi:hypothetical protein
MRMNFRHTKIKIARNPMWPIAERNFFHFLCITRVFLSGSAARPRNSEKKDYIEKKISR